MASGKDLPVSPLMLPMPEMPPVPGVRIATGMAGIRYKAREDVTMMTFPAGTTVAGVFTRNKCPGAPIDWCRTALKGGKARALVVTAGNSNVFTGKAGRETCAATAKAMAGLAGCKPNEVFLASTGVIGEKLPTEKLTAAPKVANVKSALAIRSAKSLPGVPIAVDGDKPAQPPLAMPAQ